MNNIQKYIAELILNHECVIVPGLGAFIAQPTSADIHPITHKFTPPGRTIGFNAQIKINDGLLASFIAASENTSFQLANARIEEFVTFFNESIHAYKLFNLKDVGRFFYNLEGKLEFEPDYTINFSSDSFGLTDFVFKPIERNTFDMNQPSQHRTVKSAKDSAKKEESSEKKTTKSTNTFGKIIMIVLPLIVLIGAAGYVVLYQQQDNALAGLHLFGSSKEAHKTDTLSSVVAGNMDSVEAVASSEYDSASMATQEISEELPAVVEPPVVEEAIIEKADKIINANKKHEASVAAANEIQAGSYYIIIGAFKNESNADKLLDKLSGDQKQIVKLPVDAGGFYKIALGAFDNMEAAQTEKNNLDETYHGTWIKKY